MAKYHLNGKWYTPNELSELCGIPPHTIRDRLRRGYTVEEAVKLFPIHDSVKYFGEASWWEDWIGVSINDLYEIYWSWCIRTGYKPLTKQGFSRHLLSMYPMLKTIPTKRDNKCNRIIRLRG